MTLHDTVEFARKALIGIALGFAAIIIIFFLFRLGAFIKDTFFPAAALPPNAKFGKLQALQFPTNITNASLTYRLNTVSGQLPLLPDRLNIYPIKQPQPNLLNLDKAKTKALRLDFTDDHSQVLPEKALDDINYEWQEETGIKRKLRFNTVTFDFTLTSNYLTSLTVLNAKDLSDEEHAINTAMSLLASISQKPADIDIKKTNIELFAIKDGALVSSSSLSNSHVIRVDLHQNDVTYELNTGVPLSSGGFKKLKTTLPILYSRPPYSTMTFLISSGESRQQVVQANYVYKEPEITKDIEATYPIKTASQAFEELKNGKAYIATYFGSQNEVSINKIYLAYYLADSLQEHLMPIIVFEGDDGFFAYVSAVRDEWTE